jgi:hypothetical protein
MDKQWTLKALKIQDQHSLRGAEPLHSASAVPLHACSQAVGILETCLYDRPFENPIH